MTNTSSLDLHICPKCNEPTMEVLSVFPNGTEQILHIPRECSCARKARKEEEKRAEMIKLKIKNEQLEKSRRNRNRFYEKNGLQTLFSASVSPAICFDEWQDKLSPELRKRSLDFCEDIDFRISTGIGLILIGRPRYGKTYALSCIYHYLRFTKNLAVVFCTQDDLLRATRRTWDDPKGSEDALLNNIMEADVVILDELGVGKIAEWSRSLLLKILDGAQRSNTPIIFGTNLSENQLSSYYKDPFSGEDRISPRIFEQCEVFVANEHDFSNDIRRHTQQIIKARREEKGW